MVRHQDARYRRRMTGLTVTALVLGILLLAAGVVLVLAGGRLATHVTERRLLLDPPKGAVSPVLFRGIGVGMFVVGMLVAQTAAGILLFGEPTG